MTTLYLLRHGESTMNIKAKELVGGRSNHAHLTEKGMAQAYHAGEWFKAQHITPGIVMSSPATRTIETAQQALRGMSLQATITIDDRLQELSQGAMEGKARADVWNDEALARLQLAPMDFAHPGGETFRDVQRRMGEWYNDTVEQFPNDTILVTAHGLATRALVGLLLDWDHAGIISATTGNCSLTKITHTGNTDIVECVGKTIVSL